MANFVFEKNIIVSNLKNPEAIIAGCDEVGRGCLAGPVVGCCLTFKKNAPTNLLDQITDSKKLTKSKREKLSSQIKNYAFYAIAAVDVPMIDEINILQASLLAMKTAYLKLQQTINIDSLIIDGNQKFHATIPTYTLINGDNLSLNIAGASILAKVYRDALMVNFAKTYPYYAWEKNAGYGTKTHLEGLKQYGITPLHRKTFAPIKQLINNSNPITSKP